jgi:hypothetical protein
VTSLGVDVNLSGEGTKVVELLFARVRQAVSNAGINTLFLSHCPEIPSTGASAEGPEQGHRPGEALTGRRRRRVRR